MKITEHSSLLRFVHKLFKSCLLLFIVGVQTSVIAKNRVLQPKEVLADTLLQVQFISKQTLNKRVWKAFRTRNYVLVVDSNILDDKQLIHWYSKPNNDPDVLQNIQTQPPTHYWGFLCKKGRKRELVTLFSAPSGMNLQLQDTIDFNRDSIPEIIMFWDLNYCHNSTYTTGCTRSNGIYIWDPTQSKNLLYLMYNQSGRGWSMCSGKSNSYSRKYYELEIKSDTLIVKNYETSESPKGEIYKFKEGRFEKW